MSSRKNIAPGVRKSYLEQLRKRIEESARFAEECIIKDDVSGEKEEPRVISITEVPYDDEEEQKQNVE